MERTAALVCHLPLLAVTLFLIASAVAGQASTAQLPRIDVKRCYCNNGVDNNCTAGMCDETIAMSGCASRITWTPNGEIAEFIRYCVPKFIPCYLSSGGVTIDCCEGHLCNRCPDLNVLGVATEEQFLSLNLSKECEFRLPSDGHTSNPPPPPTRNQGNAGVPGVTSPAPLWLAPVIVLAVILLLALLLAGCVCYYILSRRCKSVDVESINTSPSFEDSYRLGVSESGSSGAGKRILQNKTLSKMLTVHERIAKGGFGEVWRADWDGTDYAVKIFRSTLYDNWVKEGRIYKTCMLPHPNILHFMCMETDDTNYSVEFWLIFEYHHFGSLSSYLTSNVLTQAEGLKFLTSIASGLSYLHCSIPTSTTDKKPTIAHRDLKSGNILIKSDFSCCIGDLGLAVTEFDFAEGATKFPNPQQGTKRYLAPEILSGSIRERSIWSYVAADVYSMSLIIWEVARRCKFHGEVPAYESPYHKVVPSNPSLDDMRKIVVDDEVRPTLDANWKNDEMLSAISKILQESWVENPDCRLSSMRIKKNLQAICIESKKGFTSNE